MELISRLETAERGSPDLDMAISEATDQWWMAHPDRNVAGPWSQSLDAALALAERVLDGDHSYSLTHDWGGFNRAKVHAITDGPVTGEGDADTMPLALCIAILRAIPEDKP